MSAFLELHRVLERRYQNNFGVFIRLPSGHVINYDFIGGDTPRINVIEWDIRTGELGDEYPMLRNAADYVFVFDDEVLDKTRRFCDCRLRSGDTIDLICVPQPPEEP